jgi:hypothetical protein
VIAGFVVADHEFWAVVGQGDEELRELLEFESRAGSGPLRLCRAVLEGGVIVLGDARPSEDRWLASEPGAIAQPDWQADR